MDPLLLAVVFVLIASFLSNVSPFVGASYTLLTTAQLTAIGFTPEAYLILVFVSAIGATAAKVAIYYGAFGFRGLLTRNKNVRLIGRYSSTRAFYLVLFVAALLPIFPLDDFIYIGAGATSASLGLMTGVTLLAKVLKSGVEIALEFTFLRGLSRYLQVNQVGLTVAASAAFIVIGVLIYKLDWERAYEWMRGTARGTRPKTSASA